MQLQPTVWTTAPSLFYPETETFRNDGGSFSATAELAKLQKQCYDAYPDGLVKGYHKGRAKAYNNCMTQASTTIQVLVKENTKLQGDQAFGNTIASALGESPAAASDNTSMYIGIAVILMLAGAGYYFFFMRKKDVVAVPPVA